MNKQLYGVRFASFLCVAIFFLVLLFTHADLAMDGVRRGLSLCTETLFPSLFPFLVLSELLIVMHVGEVLSRLFSRPVYRLFGLSGNAAAALSYRRTIAAGRFSAVAHMGAGLAAAVSVFRRFSVLCSVSCR